MGTLSNLGRIVQSIFRPGRRTVITLAPPSAEDDISTEAASETDEDITLGRKKARVPGKAEPKGKQTRRQAPKVEALALPQLVISPAFKLVVILVFVLILLSGAATVLLPIFGDPKTRPYSLPPRS